MCKVCTLDKIHQLFLSIMLNAFVTLPCSITIMLARCKHVRAKFEKFYRAVLRAK